jgi:hypothetical protein
MLRVALIAAALSLGAAPKQQPHPQQQTKAAKQPAPVAQQETAAGGQQTGCPGTSIPERPCNDVTAIAADRQANLIHGSNIISLITAAVAGAAAAFAWSAASAGHNANRPWVVFDNLMPDGPDAPWKGPDGIEHPMATALRMTVRNCGPLPAIDFRSGWTSDYAPKDQVPKFEIAVDDAKGVLGPNRPVGSTAVFLTPEQRESIRGENELRLYTYGCITYRDPSRRSRVRVTEICHRISYSGVMMTPQGPMHRFNSHPIGPQNRVK